MTDPLASFADQDLSEEDEFDFATAGTEGLEEKDLLSLEEELLTDSPTHQQQQQGNKSNGGVATIESSDMEDPIPSLTRSVSDDASLLAKIEAELSEDAVSEPTDLRVTVDHPEKIVKFMESFVSYRVRTQTTRSSYEEPDYLLKRRYSDFVWLRDKLTSEHTGLLVPPLPVKNSLNLDKFDKEFIKFRETSLHRFMGRIVQHPVLSFDKSLQVFLTASDEEFTTARKSGSSLLGWVGETLHTRSAAYGLKSRPEEHTNLLEYSQKLGEKLSLLEKVAVRLHTEEQDFLSVWKEWPGLFSAWGEDEEELKQALQSTGDAVGACCSAYQEKVDATSLSMILPLKEYQLYMDVIRSVLRRRDAAQGDYESAGAELNKRKEERDQLMAAADAGLNKAKNATQEEAKKKKLEVQIEDLTKQMEGFGTKTKMADSNLKAEIDRWQSTKKADMKEVFVGLADRNITYYDKCIEAWENLLPHIQKSPLPTDTADPPEE